MRYFLGFFLPDSVKKHIATQLDAFSGITETTIPEDRWHITMLFIGETKTANFAQVIPRSLPTPYTFTATFTHLGIGANKQQLWAWIEPSPQIETLHRDLHERLKQHFKIEKTPQITPHATIARLRSDTPPIHADQPLAISCALDHLQLIESSHPNTPVTYEPIHTIALT